MKRTFGLCVALLLASQATAGEREDWDQAIDVVSKMSVDYARLADRAGEGEYLGTIMNGLDVSRHTCSILGRMLGKAAVTAHLETPYPQSTDGISTYRAAARSLNNWVSSAQRLLEEPVPMRISQWNTSCIGKMGIPATARIAEPERQILFSVFGNYLNVAGDVEKGYARKLEDALNATSGIVSVGLAGGGDDVLEAMAAARIIRRRGLDTTLDGDCESACALVFLGGGVRAIWAPHADLRMSPAIVQGQIQPTSSQIYRRIAQFVDEMGASGQIFVRLMQAGPISGYQNGRAEQLCNAAIATWIQRGCEAR